MRIRFSGTVSWIETMKNHFINDLGLVNMFGELAISVNPYPYENGQVRNYILTKDKGDDEPRITGDPTTEVFVGISTEGIYRIKIFVDGLWPDKNPLREELKIFLEEDVVDAESDNVLNEIVALSLIFYYPVPFSIKVSQVVYKEPSHGIYLNKDS